MNNAIKELILQSPKFQQEALEKGVPPERYYLLKIGGLLFVKPKSDFKKSPEENLAIQYGIVIKTQPKQEQQLQSKQKNMLMPCNCL